MPHTATTGALTRPWNTYCLPHAAHEQDRERQRQTQGQRQRQREGKIERWRDEGRDMTDREAETDRWQKREVETQRKRHDRQRDMTGKET